MTRHLTRRTFFVCGLTATFASFASPTFAQVMTREERQRLRQVRRQAIRRFRRRGAGLNLRARSAIQRGEIQPLRRLFAEVTRQLDVEVLDVDLHETQQGWIYAMRVLTPQGRVSDMYFDGRTLAMLQQSDSTVDGGVPLPPQPLPIPDNQGVID